MRRWSKEAKWMPISDSNVWSIVFRLQKCYLIIVFKRANFQYLKSRILGYSCTMIVYTLYVCMHFLASNVRSMSVDWTSTIEQVFVSILPPPQKKKCTEVLHLPLGTPCIGLIIKWIKLNKFGNSVESCRIERNGMIYLSFSFSLLLSLSVLSFDMSYLFLPVE